MNLNRVVVTGLGALTPIGDSCPKFWNNLIKGVSGASPITRIDASKFKTQFACEIKDFNFLNYFDINIKEVRKLDLFSQFALVVAKEAFEDAKVDFSAINRNKVGVVWGTGVGGFCSYEEDINPFLTGDGTPRFSPFFITKIIGNIAAGQISIMFGLEGPNCGVTSACASSANAISVAYNLIRLGKVDMMIAGGSEAPVNYSGLGGFGAMRALSTRNDDPQTASRPFDKTRDGFVLAEGAAALILESLDHAKARGAKIYAELGACGLSSDAYHITASHPDGKGARMAMQNALDEAELPASSVDYINAHGTATPMGDVAEVKAIVDLLGDHAYNINISSNKSMLGHMMGAAGAIESVATVLTIQNGIIPPTINHFEDDETLPKLNYTFNKAQERNVDVALSNAFGFGGHNVSLLFKKYKV